jgi:hypothetical protein
MGIADFQPWFGPQRCVSRRLLFLHCPMTSRQACCLPMSLSSVAVSTRFLKTGNNITTDYIALRLRSVNEILLACSSDSRMQT